MLAYLLALLVGLGSLAIYLAAFFFPEIHRKNDFIWSGVGLFYALVLWIFAHRITGGLLLGHIASVALLIWFGWQTLFLRRQLVPEVHQTPVPSSELVKVSLQEQVSKFSLQSKLGQFSAFISGIFSNEKGKVQETGSQQPATSTEQPAVENLNQTIPVPATPRETETPAVAEVTVTTPESAVESVNPTQTEAPVTEVSQEVTSPAISELVVEEETEPETPISVDEVVPDVTLTPPEVAPEKLPPSPETGS